MHKRVASNASDFSSVARVGALIATCALLASCAVGPEFQSPMLPALSARFTQDETKAGVFASSESQAKVPLVQANDPQFWRQFHDERLTHLVEQALAANLTLQAAWARLQSAQALLDQAEWDKYPKGSINGNGTQQKLASGQVVPGQPRSSRSYGVSAMLGWEVDVFGRVRRAVEAQSAEVQAGSSDLAALRIVIAAQVASTYIDLRGAQQQLQVAEANEANQRDTLSLVDKRLSAGLGTAIDVSRARAQLLSTNALAPSLRARIAVDQHRLAVLTGLAPADVLMQWTLDGGSLPFMPVVPEMIAPGTPADMLRRRPDIAAAEARLHSATARIGVATADLFPRLSLGAMLGTWALGSSSLFRAASATHSAGVNVDWAFLDIGRVKARIAASEAGAAESLAQYQQTVLTALEETENALVRFNRGRDEDELLDAAALERVVSEQLAQRMYRGGSLSFYEVLDAQRQHLIAQDAAVQSRTRSLLAAVDLYKSLAGGWEPADGVAPKLSDASAASAASRQRGQ